MTTAQLLDLICEALEVDPGTLSLETVIKEVPEWTSVGWLTIMSLVDEHFNFQLSSKEIRTFKTVADLVDFIGSKTTLVR